MRSTLSWAGKVKIVVVDHVYLEEQHVGQLRVVGEAQISGDPPKSDQELKRRISVIRKQTWTAHRIHMGADAENRMTRDTSSRWAQTYGD
jgi:hypothetical protein